MSVHCTSQQEPQLQPQMVVFSYLCDIYGWGSTRVRGGYVDRGAQSTLSQHRTESSPAVHVEAIGQSDQ